MKYLVLLRGINVGGKNKVSMAALKQLLLDLGFTNATSYINSGNVFVDSNEPAWVVQHKIEAALPKHFTLDSKILNVLVLTTKQLQQVITQAPNGFGAEPEKYYCDVIFLMNLPAEQAIKVFQPRDGVDAIWQGEQVIYSQRLGAERTKSRLNKIVGTPEYQNMTIRSWKTTKKLAELMSAEN